jgi:hypothetical protein
MRDVGRTEPRVMDVYSNVKREREKDVVCLSVCLFIRIQTPKREKERNK